jgi:hypothetical protein
MGRAELGGHHQGCAPPKARGPRAQWLTVLPMLKLHRRSVPKVQKLMALAASRSANPSPRQHEPSRRQNTKAARRAEAAHWPWLLPCHAPMSGCLRNTRGRSRRGPCPLFHPPFRSGPSASRVPCPAAHLERHGAAGLKRAPPPHSAPPARGTSPPAHRVPGLPESACSERAQGATRPPRRRAAPTPAHSSASPRAGGTQRARAARRAVAARGPALLPYHDPVLRRPSNARGRSRRGPCPPPATLPNTPVRAPGASLLRRGAAGLTRAPPPLRPPPAAPAPPHTGCRASLSRKCMFRARAAPARGGLAEAPPLGKRVCRAVAHTRATHTRRGARRQGVGGSTCSGSGASVSSPTAALAGRAGRRVGALCPPVGLCMGPCAGAGVLAGCYRIVASELTGSTRYMYRNNLFS